MRRPGAACDPSPGCRCRERMVPAHRAGRSRPSFAATPKARPRAAPPRRPALVAASRRHLARVVRWRRQSTLAAERLSNQRRGPGAKRRATSAAFDGWTVARRQQLGGVTQSQPYLGQALAVRGCVGIRPWDIWVLSARSLQMLGIGMVDVRPPPGGRPPRGMVLARTCQTQLIDAEGGGQLAEAPDVQ